MLNKLWQHVLDRVLNESPFMFNRSLDPSNNPVKYKLIRSYCHPHFTYNKRRQNTYWVLIIYQAYIWILFQMQILRAIHSRKRAETLVDVDPLENLLKPLPFLLRKKIHAWNMYFPNTKASLLSPHWIPKSILPTQAWDIFGGPLHRLTLFYFLIGKFRTPLP